MSVRTAGPARPLLVLVPAVLVAGLVSLLVLGTRGTRPSVELPRASEPAPVAVAPVPVVSRPKPAVAPRPARNRPAAHRPLRTRAVSAPRTAKPRKVKPHAVRPSVRHVSPPKVVESPTQRGTRVLASLHYDWQALGYAIRFVPGKTGLLGFTDGGTKTVTIYVRPTETDVVLAHTIAHELGHVLDFTHGNAAKHKAYLSLRGINPTTDWYGCNGCTDFHSPAGDWAEVFAYYLAGPGDFRSEMGPPPTQAQMTAIAQLYRY